MKNLTDNFKDESQKSFNRPIELYQIFFDEGTEYLAAHSDQVDYFDENGNPQTYYPFSITRRPISTDTEIRSQQTEIKIDNINLEMSSYLAHTEIQGRRIVIWKVFQDRLDDKNAYAIIFDGEMDEPRIDDNYLAITVLSPLDLLGAHLPARTFQTSCPWTFGGEECGILVPNKTITISDISADRMTISSNDITEGSGHWNYGSLVINKRSRVINDSGSGYVEIEYPLPGDVGVGDSVRIDAGCDKSYNAGHGCDHWDNKDYYGGFRSIPNVKDVRSFG